MDGFSVYCRGTCSGERSPRQFQRFVIPIPGSLRCMGFEVSRESPKLSRIELDVTEACGLVIPRSKQGPQSLQTPVGPPA